MQFDPTLIPNPVAEISLSADKSTITRVPATGEHEKLRWGTVLVGGGGACYANSGVCRWDFIVGPHTVANTVHLGVTAHCADSRYVRACSMLCVCVCVCVCVCLRVCGSPRLS